MNLNRRDFLGNVGKALAGLVVAVPMVAQNARLYPRPGARYPLGTHRHAMGSDLPSADAHRHTYDTAGPVLVIPCGLHEYLPEFRRIAGWE